MGAQPRLRRLFIKNTGLCQVERRGIGADSCPMLEGEGDWLVHLWTKLRTEALVNGGRNYNGPKVAKFLVG